MIAPEIPPGYEAEAALLTKAGAARRTLGEQAFANVRAEAELRRLEATAERDGRADKNITKKSDRYYTFLVVFHGEYLAKHAPSLRHHAVDGFAYRRDPGQAGPFIPRDAALEMLAEEPS